MLKTIYKISILAPVILASSLCIAAEVETTSNNEIIKTPNLFDFKTYWINATANQAEEIKDPLQPFNRKVYAFNDAIDQSVLRPTAVFYSTVTPVPAQSGYSNFKNNLREPWSAVNQLLQGKPIQSLKSLGRFTINTATSLGFADTAKHLNLAQEKDNFGTTLGVWGVPSGPYVVLPFLGSSTLRDTVGLIPDSFARPNSYVIEQDRLLYSMTALDVVSTRAQFLGVDSIVPGDKYSVLRDVYLQQRAFEIGQKRGEDVASATFNDDPFDDESFEEESLNDEDTIESTPEE